MDLLALYLTLRPLDDGRPAASLPTWWGRASQALLLQICQQLDPTLAAALHDAPRNPVAVLGLFTVREVRVALAYRLDRHDAGK